MPMMLRHAIIAFAAFRRHIDTPLRHCRFRRLLPPPLMLIDADFDTPMFSRFHFLSPPEAGCCFLLLRHAALFTLFRCHAADISLLFH